MNNDGGNIVREISYFGCRTELIISNDARHYGYCQYKPFPLMLKGYDESQDNIEIIISCRRKEKKGDQVMLSTQITLSQSF